MEENKEKTKWNSNLFSENTDASEKEGFQLLNIKQKIKRIKKGKKAELDNNFKNIETFETLDNAPKEGFNPSSKCDDNPGDPDCKGYIPALMDDTTCPDPDYEGCDAGDSEANEKNPKQMLIDFINKVYRWFDAKFFLIAFVIAMAAGGTYKTMKNTVKIGRKRLKTKDSQKTASENIIHKQTAAQYNSILKFDVSKFVELPKIKDVQLVKKYVEWVCATLISCYAVFHIFFLFYYKHELYYKDGVELKDISTKKLRADAASSFYSIESIFLFFFQFSWWFVESFEYYFNKYYVQTTKKYLNATLSFILLFVCLIWFFYYYPPFIKSFLFDMLDINLDNKFLSFMYFVFVILVIMDLLNLFNYLPTGPVYYKFTFMIIIRLVIMSVLTLPFSGIFIYLYVLIYSLFGIFLYGKDELGYFEIFKTLNKFAEDTKNQIRIGTECSPNTFFEKVMITINVIMDFIYTYIFYLAFLVIFVFSFYDYSVNIQSNTLKGGLLSITAVFIIMLCSFCINSFRLRVKDKFAAHPAT